jgi:hypothetical protein
MKTVPALGTSFSFGSVTARIAQTLAALIPASATSDRNARPVSLQLVRGEVHRVDQADGIREIHVLDGTLWLTTTPADGDILLRSGDRFALPVTGRVVFEALQDASILLARHMDARS